MAAVPESFLWLCQARSYPETLEIASADLLHLFKFILVDAADGADPVFREILKRDSRFDTALLVSFCRVEYAVTGNTTLFSLLCESRLVSSHHGSEVFVRGANGLDVKVLNQHVGDVGG